jgi:hypothetical protein
MHDKNCHFVKGTGKHKDNKLYVKTKILKDIITYTVLQAHDNVVQQCGKKTIVLRAINCTAWNKNIKDDHALLAFVGISPTAIPL